MNKEEHDQLEKLFRAISKLEESGILTEEQKKEFSDLKSSISGVLLSSWLPADSGRKYIMLIILFIAICGTLAGIPRFLFLLLILPLFSPRVIGEVVVFFGRIMGNK